MNRQPIAERFYPANIKPEERMKIARREITLHVSCLKKMLANLSQEIKRAGNFPLPRPSDMNLTEELYKQALLHFQGVVREMHQVRRAVVEHLDNKKEREHNE